MKGSLDNNLKNKIKTLIIENCELDIDVNDIADDLPLFAHQSELELDSIDALQISIAIQNTYGIAIRDSKEMRRVMQSVNTFADFLQPG
jgi:acyl carrier protein